MKPDIIRKKIFEVRGEKIMLDFDLAVLYEVETRVLNQAVKRNPDKFPKDFMFRLTKKEWQPLLSQIAATFVTIPENNSSQIVMSSRKHRGKAYLPYAFAEHGVEKHRNHL